MGLALAALSGCDSLSPQEIATHTRHCGSVRVSPKVTVRLSIYPRGNGSAWLIQACGEGTTACTPLVSYGGAPPPILSFHANTLEVALLGGSAVAVHAETFKSSGEMIKVSTNDVSKKVGVDQYFSDLDIPMGTPDMCGAWARRRI